MTAPERLNSEAKKRSQNGRMHGTSSSANLSPQMLLAKAQALFLSWSWRADQEVVIGIKVGVYYLRPMHVCSSRHLDDSRLIFRDELSYMIVNLHRQYSNRASVSSQASRRSAMQKRRLSCQEGIGNPMPPSSQAPDSKPFGSNWQLLW